MKRQYFKMLGSFAASACLAFTGIEAASIIWPTDRFLSLLSGFIIIATAVSASFDGVSNMLNILQVRRIVEMVKMNNPGASVEVDITYTKDGHEAHYKEYLR